MYKTTTPLKTYKVITTQFKKIETLVKATNKVEALNVVDLLIKEKADFFSSQKETQYINSLPQEIELAN